MRHARSDHDRFQDRQAKIGQDEPVMLFRASDRHFADVLAYYMLRLAKDRLADPRMIVVVAEHIRLAQVWQEENGCKTPHIPPP